MKALTVSIILLLFYRGVLFYRSALYSLRFFSKAVRLLAAVFIAFIVSVNSAEVSAQNTQEAPSSPLPDLDIELGHQLFERNWVSAPASTTSSDGLGPLYNSRSCEECHQNAGGGRLQDGGMFWPQALVVQFPQASADFGRQLQLKTVADLAPEVDSITLSYTYIHMEYADEDGVDLRQPNYIVHKENQISDLSGHVISARLAPELYGLSDLLLISHAVENEGEKTGLGWQASSHSLQDQVSRALAFDMGLSNPLYPDAAGDCTVEQVDCVELANSTLTGEQPEISQELVDLMVGYLESLPAPSTPDNYLSLEGADLFIEAGCASCHIPQQQIGGKNISAYTDMRVHDMGVILADKTASGRPVSTYWRTPPLWNIAEKLSSYEALFLHDGRAQTLEEAILWHGGEAESARFFFQSLDRDQRIQLLTFLSRL